MGYSVLDSYSRWWRMRGLADTTLKTYVSSLNIFVRDVLADDEAALLDVDRGTLEHYVDKRLTTSVNAAHCDVRAFKSFYGWASGDGDEMDENPAKRLRHPKVDEPPVRVATDEVLEKLIKVCGRDKLGRRDAAVISVLYSGPRRGELVVCDLEHLDLANGWLSIPKTKGGRPRRIPLAPIAVTAIDRWLRVRGEAPGPLFVSHRGERLLPNGIGQMILRRSREAGVEFASHDARRLLAERLIRSGNEVALSSLAGWAPGSRMPARYSRMHAEEIAHDVFRKVVG